MSTNANDAEDNAHNVANNAANSNVDNERLVQNSIEEVWFLKEIIFKSQPVKIITQNYNGYACTARLVPYHM